MNPLQVAPIQWSSLKNIDAVEPINDGDMPCLIEVRDVLRKHGKLDRFGVTLVHSHFPLTDDEVMLETADEESRTLITKATKRSDTGSNIVGTMWVLGEGDINTMSWCRRYCHDGLFGHSPRHNVVPGK